jgi:hypothetical protein
MDELRIGVFRSDTTRALVDGDARVSTAATMPEIFEGMLRHRAYDVAELGLTFLLRALEQGDDLVALPVFPTRVFRHSCVFVGAGSGITGPADLVGRRIGEFGVYGQDSGVWIKGVLVDEHGFRPEDNEWVIGGLDRPAPPFGFTTHPHPVPVEVVEDRALSAMLESGEIDALFTANVPQPYLDGSPRITRLFPDHVRVERDWFRRTGIFPMMHALVARRGTDPAALREVYDTFLAAKDAAAEQYRHDARWYHVQHMLPWTNALFEEDQRLLGRDWWPYGIAANRHALDTYLRYHHEQGLSRRRWTVEEVFAPDLLDT